MRMRGVSHTLTSCPFFRDHLIGGPQRGSLRVQARVSARRRGLGGEPGGQDRGIDGWLPLRWPNVRATYA